MRVYANAYELMSEIMREVFEMGHIVHPNSMQNKKVKGMDEYSTKEITNYSYSLTSLNKVDFLFLADSTAKAWANAEFSERIDMDAKNPGEAWKLREHVWKEFLYLGKFEYTYSQRLNYLDSLNRVIFELKTNPDTRQAILSVWNPNDIMGLGGIHRVPCSMYYQFMVRKGRLNIIYNQRSADVVTHFGNDVYLAWRLMEHVAKESGIKPGYLFHNIGSLHAYKKDWERLKLCITDIKA